MSDNKNKILDKAKKLKALADNGVGGEKENAKKLLNEYISRHGISFKDLDNHIQKEDVYKNFTNKDILNDIKNELKSKGLHFMANSFHSLSRNMDMVNMFKSKSFNTKDGNREVVIDWRDNLEKFTVEGLINNKIVFDIQLLKDGALIYPTVFFKTDKPLKFDSIELAKEYCNKIKNNFKTV